MCDGLRRSQTSGYPTSKRDVARQFQYFATTMRTKVPVGPKGSLAGNGQIEAQDN